MANPFSEGRMIRRDISSSRGFASLSPAAQLLFCLLIPHFNSHGKMNGSPYFVKGEVVPLLGQYDVPEIVTCLQEISTKTNVKWFEVDGLSYLHATKWFEHQCLRDEKLGTDRLPSYAGGEAVAVAPAPPVGDKGTLSLESVPNVPADAPSAEPVPAKAPKAEEYPADFLAFWVLYPNKKSGKANAYKSWRTVVVKKGVDVAAVMSGLRNHLDSTAWQKDGGDFIPHATTWLNQQRWDADFESQHVESADAARFRRWWLHSFETVVGYPYVVGQGSHDERTIGRLLGSGGLQEVVRRACRLFMMHSPAGRKPTIARLEYLLNELDPVNPPDLPVCRELGIYPPDGVRFAEWAPVSGVSHG